MKTSFGLILGLLVSTSLLADQTDAPPATAPAPLPAATNADTTLPPVTNEPAAAPIAAGAPATQTETSPTNAPTASPAKKKKPARTKPAARKSRVAESELKTVPLVPGPAMVVARRVNVRGQPKLRSEVLTQMTNGDTVNVIEEIRRKHTGPTEPSVWAKIELPQGAHAWVHGHFINPDTKQVIPKLLNIRGGPGENYSILGQLHQGDTITEIKTDSPWIEIEPPTNAYAYMAAAYLQQETEVPTNEVAEIAPAETPTPTPVEENTNVITAASGMPEMTNLPGATNAPATAAALSTNELAEATPAETPVTPPPSPVVQREGMVRATLSIQAPTKYELASPDNWHTIDYLYTTSTNLDLSRYKGLRIIVTGKEGMDRRWKRTPVLTIQRIQVIE